MDVSKINYANWGKSYRTPQLAWTINQEYYQLSFIVWNYHWWILIAKKGYKLPSYLK